MQQPYCSLIAAAILLQIRLLQWLMQYRSNIAAAILQNPRAFSTLFCCCNNYAKGSGILLMSLPSQIIAKVPLGLKFSKALRLVQKCNF